MTSSLNFKYCSIENSYNEKILNIIKADQVSNIEWIAQEKIHGSNASFIIQKNNPVILRASRNQLLNGSATFHNLENIQIKLEPSLRKLESILSNIYTNYTSIHVFGEVFGGFMPGVKNPNNNKPVQKEIIYSINYEFLIFDIMIITNDNEKQFINIDKVIEYCQMTELPYLPILYRGNLEDMLKLNPVYISTIPSLLNYKQQFDNNFSEGFVLKPIIDTILPNKSRVILKLKNKKFLEKDDNIKFVKVKSKLENNDEIEENIKAYININRVNSVKSKYSEIPNNLIPLIIEDVYNDYIKDHHVENKNIKIVKTLIGKHTGIFLKNNNH